MIKSYFQNATVSMTKEVYFEMCDALGNEPVEDEIPVDLEDFPNEVQDAILLYHKLKDDWDTMNGRYMGKSYIGLKEVLEILEIPKEDWKVYLDWIAVMDTARTDVMDASKPKDTKQKTSVG